MQKSTKNKTHFRLLPLFIFFAALTLSVKINNVFDQFRHPAAASLSISPNTASAEEKLNRETAELSEALERGGKASSGPAGSAVAESGSAFSQSEILILQELAERREALDLRAKEIDKKAIQLKIAEEEIDKKLKQLQTYEQKLENLIHQYNQQEQEQLNSLVKLYTAMKPKDAARIFNTLDMDILVALMKEMKPSAASAILSQMNAERAKTVTTELLGNQF